MRPFANQHLATKATYKRRLNLTLDEPTKRAMAQTNVLVVEDESIVSKDIQHSLKKLGYQCRWAPPRTGEQAVKLAIEHHAGHHPHGHHAEGGDERDRGRRRRSARRRTSR